MKWHYSADCSHIVGKTGISFINGLVGGGKTHDPLPPLRPYRAGVVECGRDIQPAMDEIKPFPPRYLYVVDEECEIRDTVVEVDLFSENQWQWLRMTPNE